MNRHINFEDNIFILNIRIRMVQDLLILDTDAELFLNKTMEDLEFINATLTILLSGIKENCRLIDRDELFHNLAETERQFRDVLSELDNGEGTISANHYTELRERISFLAGRSRDREQSVTELISSTGKLVLEPVVGYDELHELLSR